MTVVNLVAVKQPLVPWLGLPESFWPSYTVPALFVNYIEPHLAICSFVSIGYLLLIAAAIPTGFTSFTAINHLTRLSHATVPPVVMVGFSVPSSTCQQITIFKVTFALMTFPSFPALTLNFCPTARNRTLTL